MKTLSIFIAIVTSGIIASAATVPVAAESLSEKAQVQANLERFDQLDFDAYSHRQAEHGHHCQMEEWLYR